MDCKNYRPVSLTNVACKLLEYIVRFQLLDYLLGITSNDPLTAEALLSSEQHGFLPDRSTQTQLLDSTLLWTKALNNTNGRVDIIYTDLAKAFDSVSHKKLLFKMRRFGIGGNLIRWFQNFLSDRYQSVRVGNSVSVAKAVLSGVPQGTLLGPILFLIIINGVDSVVTPGTHIKLYADDAKIFREIKYRSDCDILQNDLNTVVQFLTDWQLKINIDKCSSLKLMRSRCSKNFAYDYNINGVTIKNSSCERDLGVYVSTHPIHGLAFSKHISITCAKARRMCFLINRFFTNRNPNFQMRLFNVYVRPILEYISPVWNPFLIKDIDALESVQRSFTKHLNGMQHFSYQKRLKLLNAEMLEIRRIRADLMEVYKVFHRLDCLRFDNFFQRSTRNVRHGHSENLLVQRTDKEVFKNFWSNRTIKIWNSLPTEVVLAESTAIFKKRLLKCNLTMFLKGSIRLELEN